MSDVSPPRVLNREAGWYRGDFHVHTSASADEALYPLSLVTELARVEGLDFIAVTDHNTIEGLSQPGVCPDLLVVPGIEITVAEGDFNVFGVEGWHAWMKDLSAGRLQGAPPGTYGTTTELMRRVAAEGLLNSINHPCLPPWEWQDDTTDLRYVHCVEVWNDPYWPDNVRANPKAVALWTAWLDGGHRITAIGGSDYHHPPRPEEGKPGERLGLPSTYVYAKELSATAILEGLRRRRAYVSIGPRVSFQAHAGGSVYGMGSALGIQSGEIELRADIVVDHAKTVRGQIVSSSAVHAVTQIRDDRTSLQCQATVTPDPPHWYRLEVRSPEEHLLAITNPIFVGPRREPRLHRYGDFTP
ncbi:MAG: CehA/McbA family metallohydrolase [Anaerolineae bacterium]|jgi:hypothetical protein